jgi:hypothetical protein
LWSYQVKETHGTIGPAEEFIDDFFPPMKDAILRLPELIGEPNEKGT